MKKCPECGFENPDRNRSCVKCGHVFRTTDEEDPTNDDTRELEKEIQGLKLQLSGKDQELAGLKSTLSGKDKEIEGLQSALSAKDEELADLRKKIDAISKPVPPLPDVTPIEPPLPDVTPVELGPGLLIDSYPLKKPKFQILMDDTKQSVDLSATDFHIHATLERTSAGIELVVQAGATVNIRLSEKQKWQRYTGGSRVTTVTGMILFDPVGAMNARLDNSSG